MNKLEFLRKKHKLSQQKVADVLGITVYYYRLIETEKEMLTVEKINILAKLYDVPPDFLVEDPRLLLAQRIQKCPEDWLPEISQFLNFLEYKNR